MDFAKTLAFLSYGRLTVMAVQLTAILLDHAQPLNNSCRPHTYTRAALASSATELYGLSSKQVDGLQWILLKHFSSRIMAGSPVMAVLDTSEDIVDCPDTFRSDPYCRTALGVQKDLVKSLSPSILPTC